MRLEVTVSQIQSKTLSVPGIHMVVVKKLGTDCSAWFGMPPSRKALKNILSLNWCPPHTEIFSKRRKIYTIVWRT